MTESSQSQIGNRQSSIVNLQFPRPQPPLFRSLSSASLGFEHLKLGFGERIRGSHHIFSRDGVEEILNLQPKGSKAKPYQVKQVRHVILKYRLGDGVDA